MKLSQAMREGAKLRPQGFGGYTTPPLQSDVIDVGYYTCALGAATEALLIESRSGVVMAWEIAPYAEVLHIKCNDKTTAQCPQCDTIPAGLCDVVSHLNDDHKWMREEIAAWLEGLGY